MTKADVEKYLADTHVYIEKLEKRLKGRLTGVLKYLYQKMDKLVLSKLSLDSEGRIKDTAGNMRLINRIPKILQSYDYLPIIAESVADYMTLINKSSPYFKLFDIERQRIEAAKAGLNAKMLRRARVFKTMSVDKQAAIKVRKLIIKEMSKEVIYKDMKKKVIDMVVTKGRPLSHALTELADVFMEGDRIIVEDMAENLGLNQYYLYSSGLVKNSRTFCEDHVGKVFTRKEINKWKGQSWQGKSSPYDPFVNVGGYRCRHRLSPISERMYNRLK